MRALSHVQYLSIGIDQWKPPLMYGRLKIIELYQVSFEDIKEILVVLRLIINSPNLQELHISVSTIDSLRVYRNLCHLHSAFNLN